ncbi:MAG TPA: RiPP maturation radical SAM C-methyltransferase [Tepidiformaceae bacterium]|nr:RiPP maturation radical SAM C-methyltransferase [Tepidiformaceae bacterium]
MVESTAQPERELRGVLVSMPWATIVRPSLAVGILARICEEADVEVLSLHANLDMAARIGTDAAAILSDERMLYGLADHFFACDLYGADTLDSNQFVKVLGNLNPPGIFRRKEYVRQLRDQIVPAYLDEMTERVLAHNPDFVGFSATFNQVMGSLALAARIKKARPEVVVIAGGACFDGEMGREYHRALPEALDHVFMGEAEESFREFLRRLKSGESTDGIPGVTWREGSEVRLEPGSPLADMSASPAPTYDDYFRQRRELQQRRGLAFQVESLPFESSRGCWWGQNSHCVFCGINDDVMPFREKTVDRVIEEMVGLASRYRVTKLTAADWIISKRQRKEIFQRLADLNYDIDCFYETRVDLPKEEVALMKAAGVTSIQPGIESLSTELLHHMGKGTSRIRVVQFLRWAKEYGIHLSYNILGDSRGSRRSGTWRWRISSRRLSTCSHRSTT